MSQSRLFSVASKEAAAAHNRRRYQRWREERPKSPWDEHKPRDMETAPDWLARLPEDIPRAEARTMLAHFYAFLTAAGLEGALDRAGR